MNLRIPTLREPSHSYPACEPSHYASIYLHFHPNLHLLLNLRLTSTCGGAPRGAQLGELRRDPQVKAKVKVQVKFMAKVRVEVEV